MRVPVRTLGCLAGAALAAGPACSPPVAPKTYPVIVHDLAFGPMPTQARVGDTIEWDNEDPFVHSATAKDEGFDVELKPGARLAMPLKNAGTFEFICRYHPGMKGRLVVGR